MSLMSAAQCHGRGVAELTCLAVSSAADPCPQVTRPLQDDQIVLKKAHKNAENPWLPVLILPPTCISDCQRDSNCGSRAGQTTHSVPQRSGPDPAAPPCEARLRGLCRDHAGGKLEHLGQAGHTDPAHLAGFPLPPVGEREFLEAKFDDAAKVGDRRGCEPGQHDAVRALIAPAGSNSYRRQCRPDLRALPGIPHHRQVGRCRGHDRIPRARCIEREVCFSSSGLKATAFSPSSDSSADRAQQLAVRLPSARRRPGSGAPAVTHRRRRTRHLEGGLEGRPVISIDRVNSPAPSPAP